MEKNRILLWQWVWGLILLGLLIVISLHMGKVAVLVLLSFLVSYILNPLVTRLARLRFLGRSSATLITLFTLTIGFITILFFLIPHVTAEARQFVNLLPGLIAELDKTVTPFLEEHLVIRIPRNWSDVSQQLLEQIRNRQDQWLQPVTQLTRTVFSTTYTAIFVLVAILMFPVFLFFLLKDFPRIIATADSLIPHRYQIMVHTLARDVDRSLSAFLHGQFTVMVVLGSLYSLGYYLVGIPLSILIGLITGILCFIPYLGAATGFSLALLMALLSFSGWPMIVGVIVVFAGVQTLDAVFITPRILGGKLGLQPLWIIVALMAGGEMFGFLGVLLAVPTMAVLKVLVSHSVAVYRNSPVYTDPAHNEEAPPSGTIPQPPA